MKNLTVTDCFCVCHERGLRGCHDCAAEYHPHLLEKALPPDPGLEPVYERWDFLYQLKNNIGK